MQKTRKQMWNKVYTVLIWLFRLTLLVTLIVGLMQKDTKNAGYAVITLALTFYEILLRKIFRIKLKISLKICILLFIIGTQFLGTILDVYGIWYWWDTLLHGLSGILFFYVGYTSWDEINKRSGRYRNNPILKIAFGLCFVMAIGVLWEVLEYGVDTFLGGNMQLTVGAVGRDAISDTMSDLMAATIGGILTTIYEGIQLRRKNRRLER